MRLGIDPKIDYAFKRVFGSEGNKHILIDLINSVLRLPPAEEVATVQLLNPFSEKDALDDKLSILDIKARDQQGRRFNVEMQMVGRHSLPSRLLYYWSKLYTEQLHKRDDYEKLCPTITICLLNDELLPGATDHHLRFQLVDREHEIVLTNQLDIHLIELPKFRRRLDELGEPLDQWLYFLRHAKGLDPDALPSSLNRQPIHQAVKELKMLTENEIFRQRYEAREKAYRDAIWAERDQRRRDEELRARDEELRARGEELRAREEELRARGEEFRARGEEFRTREEKLRAREEKLRARDEEVQTRAEEVQVKSEETLQESLRRGELIGRIHVCQRLLKQSPSPMPELEGMALDDLQALADRLESHVTSPSR